LDKILDDKSALGAPCWFVFDIILSQATSFGRPVLWKQETVSLINQNQSDMTGIHVMVHEYIYASEVISLSIIERYLFGSFYISSQSI